MSYRDFKMFYELIKYKGILTQCEKNNCLEIISVMQYIPFYKRRREWKNSRFKDYAEKLELDVISRLKNINEVY